MPLNPHLGPSQQLARMDGKDVLSLISGAEYLLTNDYERSLLETKAGLTADQHAGRCGARSVGDPSLRDAVCGGP